MSEASYFVGLDLGQAQDPTALCILERPARESAEERDRRPVYQVRGLKRYHLGTPYTEIVQNVRFLVGTRPLDRNCAALVVDQTGVGAAVVDMFRSADLMVPVRPALITAGHAVNLADDGSWHVAKKELVSVLQVLLQSRRLKVARDLPDAAMLVKE